jgi:hypothetical protein
MASLPSLPRARLSSSSTIRERRERAAFPLASREPRTRVKEDRFALDSETPVSLPRMESAPGLAVQANAHDAVARADAFQRLPLSAQRRAEKLRTHYVPPAPIYVNGKHRVLQDRDTSSSLPVSASRVDLITAFSSRPNRHARIPWARDPRERVDDALEQTRPPRRLERSSSLSSTGRAVQPRTRMVLTRLWRDVACHDGVSSLPGLPALPFNIASSLVELDQLETQQSEAVSTRPPGIAVATQTDTPRDQGRPPRKLPTLTPRQVLAFVTLLTLWREKQKKFGLPADEDAYMRGDAPSAAVSRTASSSSLSGLQDPSLEGLPTGPLRVSAPEDPPPGPQLVPAVGPSPKQTVVLERVRSARSATVQELENQLALERRRSTRGLDTTQSIEREELRITESVGPGIASRERRMSSVGSARSVGSSSVVSSALPLGEQEGTHPISTRATTPENEPPIVVPPALLTGAESFQRLEVLEQERGTSVKASSPSPEERTSVKASSPSPEERTSVKASSPSPEERTSVKTSSPSSNEEDDGEYADQAPGLFVHTNELNSPGNWRSLLFTPSSSRGRGALLESSTTRNSRSKAAEAALRTAPASGKFRFSAASPVDSSAPPPLLRDVSLGSSARLIDLQSKLTAPQAPYPLAREHSTSSVVSNKAQSVLTGALKALQEDWSLSGSEGSDDD